MPYAKDHKTRSRSRILQSAMELFARYGFKKVSISQIMKEARMTHGAFYAHFESKESLYSASFLELLKESGRSRLVKAPLPIKKLIALASNYWNLRQQAEPGPGPETLLFNEVGNDNEKIRPLLQSSYEDLRHLLERRLKALSRLQKLEVSSALIRDRARAILASLVGAVTLARMLPDDEERHELLRVAQTQILAQMQLSPVRVSDH
ncbi:TetR/AcrR family transcriptional regulator [Marinospirillum perlucidum]|uniref:TetR/AcrR family transcriptional regulator n=1 Tax=Marinospirillum perlucidum TaxID=1982602 RepID=UPI000DF488F9|nr:TetR/AcrR family transcriptional regulator [Marinospirillum perlucidum]